jgi:peptidoglycan/xylan/chitin deacetylase (PgdA/CDA1 family)
VLAAGLRPVPVGAAGPQTIAVTFDDGFDDVLRVAAPVLAERGVPFSVYVTTSFLGRPGYLTEAGLRELAAAPGVTIGAHGVTHAVLTRCDDDTLRHELAGARAQLADLVGRDVEELAYPHGVVDGRVRAAAADAGYARAVTSRYGVNTATTDPLLLRRVEVVTADRARDVVAKSTGRWDWLGLRPSPTR